MATPISDASNELKGSGLANIHGGKTRYQSHGELHILQNSPFAHYKCIYIELSCKITNVEYGVCGFSALQTEWRTNH